MPQDVCLNDLKFIIEYVYRGEINVSQAGLQVSAARNKVDLSSRADRRRRGRLAISPLAETRRLSRSDVVSPTFGNRRLRDARYLFSSPATRRFPPLSATQNIRRSGEKWTESRIAASATRAYGRPGRDSRNIPANISNLLSAESPAILSNDERTIGVRVILSLTCYYESRVSRAPRVIAESYRQIDSPRAFRRRKHPLLSLVYFDHSIGGSVQ